MKEEAIANGCPIEHSLIVIDDYANDLKDKQLSQMINKAIVKTRHLNCSWIYIAKLYIISKSTEKTNYKCYNTQAK